MTGGCRGGVADVSRKEIQFRDRACYYIFMRDYEDNSTNGVNSDLISTLNADDAETRGKLGRLEETNIYFPSSFRPWKPH